jgi:hypothetical protein
LNRARLVRAAPYLVLAVFALLGARWGLPCVDTWASDSVSPRVSGLASGLRETYATGSFFTYPPLHLLVLAVPALPAWAVAALRAPHAPDAMRLVLIREPYMTYFEVTSRLVTLAMALGVVRNVVRATERVWDARAALVAGLAVACNPIFVYYAHTGNLDVPALFWATAALDEMARVAAGETARLRRALVLCALATLTKDQALGLVIGPALVVLFPLVRGRATRRGALAAVGIAAAVYLVVAGAVVNPTGWARRVAFLLGPASRDWTPYPATPGGLLALARGLALRVHAFGGTLAAVAAAAGVWLSLRPAKLPRLLPALAALSFTLTFGLGARRDEARFILPQTVVLAPYVAIAALAGGAWAKRVGSRLAWIVVAAPLALPALESLRVDATLMADARYAATRYLASLPAGTRVELYGPNPTLPRLPDGPDYRRGGGEDPAERGIHPRLLGGRDARGLGSAARDADVLVVSRRWAEHFADARTAHARAAVDPRSVTFFGALAQGALPGWRRVSTARCTLPFGLACERLHASTGDEIWIFGRSGAEPGAP